MIRKKRFFNKKAVSSMMRLTFALIFLFIVFRAGATIVKPLLNPDSKTLAVQSFDNLVFTIEQLKNPHNYEKSNQVLITLESSYYIAGFDTNQNDVKLCLLGESKSVYDLARPPDCGTNEACLCLVHVRDSSNKNFIKCQTFSEEIDFYSELSFSNIGCGRIDGLRILNYNGTRLPPILSMTQTKEVQDVYIGMAPDEFKPDYMIIPFRPVSESFYVEVVDLTKGMKYFEPHNKDSIMFDDLRGQGAIRILITSANAFNKALRYKITSVCPDNSDGDCGSINGHVSRTVDGVYEENGQLFYCSFNKIEEKCENKTIELCKTNSHPTSECACQGLMVNDGFCINDKAIALNYGSSFGGKVEKCEDYGFNTFECAFDVNNVGSYGCYKEKINSKCENCPTGSNTLKRCNEYKNDVSCMADACNVLKGSDEMFCNYDEQNNKCYLDYRPNSKFCNHGEEGCVQVLAGPFYHDMKCDYFDEFKTICQASIISNSNNCDFYTKMNPTNSEQILRDPCNCDFDSGYPDPDGCQ